MSYSILLILVVLLAVPILLLILALAVHLLRKKMNGNKPVLTQDLDSAQVDEITSTYTLLNH